MPGLGFRAKDLFWVSPQLWSFTNWVIGLRGGMKDNLPRRSLPERKTPSPIGLRAELRRAMQQQQQQHPISKFVRFARLNYKSNSNPIRDAPAPTAPEAP